MFLCVVNSLRYRMNSLVYMQKYVLLELAGSRERVLLHIDRDHHQLLATVCCYTVSLDWILCE